MTTADKAPKTDPALITVRLPLTVTSDDVRRNRHMQIESLVFPVPMRTLLCHGIMFSHAGNADPQKIPYTSSSYTIMFNRVAMRAFCDCLCMTAGTEAVCAVVARYGETADDLATDLVRAVRAAGRDTGAWLLAIAQYANRCVSAQLGFMLALSPGCAKTGPGAAALHDAMESDRQAIDDNRPTLESPLLREMAEGRGVYSAELAEYARESREPRAGWPFRTAHAGRWSIGDDRPWSELVDPLYVEDEVEYLLRRATVDGDLPEVVMAPPEQALPDDPSFPAPMTLPAASVKGEIRAMFPEMRTYC